MSCIRILPENLVMKIAAGEVLERPGSAVKELLENAVDAGATHIGLTVEAGGTALIRITDDGCGMSAEDLALAVTPHATSKIHAEDDLYRIGSLGFRGEALASIAAVSRLRLLSRPHESNEGHEIEIVAEDVRSSRAAGCPAGTTVEVRDLFFSVPARRKFLKQASTEFGHVNTQFARLALAYPRIAFDLANNGKKVQQLPAAASRLERIAKLYSRELADALIEFRSDEAGLSIEGYAAPPADARSSANWQFTFVNGRFIRDKFVQHAVKEAYRGLIDPRRFPVIFLFLSIDPAAVDVNAHPTKIEVRWHDSNTVHSQVLSALRKALQAADLTPSLSTSSAPEAPSPEWQANLRSDFAREFKNTPPMQPSVAFGADRGMGGSDGRSDRVTSHQDVGDDVWRTLHGQSDDGSVQRPDPPQPLTETRATSHSAIQLHNTYLVCETSDGMVIIDQHALHERILYEDFKQRITSGSLESQRLLLPETVPVTPAQAALLETNAALLEQLGLEITPFGPNSVAIQSFPTIMKDTDAAGFLRDLLDKLEQLGNQPHTEVIVHEVLDMMACKAAVKAGDPLTQEEIRALVDRKELVEKSSNCPHGRPTTLRLTVQDLERQFKRT